MIKNTIASANWHMYDNQRDVRNVAETGSSSSTLMFKNLQQIIKLIF